MKKAIVTCSLTGVLTDPQQHPVPVSASEMAISAREAFDAGASVMHVHFRNQRPGLGHLPTWEPEVVHEIAEAIRAACPGVILNFSTGIVGKDISGPTACLERSKPEMAAMNAGSLNYLKATRAGKWAWPPMLFDNPVEKISAYLKVMDAHGIVPECECFDVGILRSIEMFRAVGLLRDPLHVSLVMGVASGMPADPDLLPVLMKYIPSGAQWQGIVIGREDVWPVHRKVAELGGHLRTGVEDTFYLPDGSRTRGNGPLIEALVKLARECGREIASPEEARALIRH
ncbi:MAG TPA: 3-keto-5-aminohexanoate cleavage protein [Nevskiaceae bacterium]|nr:3-keto-5-aminohexanoate cleavage protein [Nevskiaceae bacterium]